MIMTTMQLQQYCKPCSSASLPVTIIPSNQGMIKKIGIQGPAGLTFAFNDSENQNPNAIIYLGETEIYELDLLNLGVSISKISLLSMPATATLTNKSIIVDYVVELTTTA